MRTGTELGVLALRAVPLGLALVIAYPLLLVAVITTVGFTVALVEGGLLIVLVLVGVVSAPATVLAVVFWAVAQRFECVWLHSRTIHLLILVAGVAAYGIALAIILLDDHALRGTQPGMPHAAMCAGVLACILSIATWPFRAKQDATDSSRSD